MARKKSEPVAETASPGVPEGEYTVVARRYRPQQFGQLVGQDAVAQSLGNAIKAGRVAHAYLFTGARGVGKTTTARILAKCLNCVQGPTLTPCDECEICKGVMTGEDVDVVEIDAASNTGVDNIRDLRNNVQYRPQRARYKIYIIDEVHMLSKGAFNALLKTLEEPPPHVKFIFATTEVTKIPITILSRCQRFDFSGMTLTQLKGRLKEIVESEGTTAEDDAIDMIARRAAGSMRDAQSLLDQLLSFGDGPLTVARIHQMLGTSHEDRVAAVATAVVEKDAKKALALVAESADQGLQLGELLDQLIEYWRDLMVVNAAGVEDQSLSVTTAHRAVLERQARALSLETIMAGLDILVAAKNRIGRSIYGRVILEMALVRVARLEHLVGVGQLVQWLQEGGAAVTPSAPRGADSEKKKLTAEPKPAVGPISLDSGSISLVWGQLLDQTGVTLRAELSRSVGQAISGPNTLVVRFPHGYNLLDGPRKAAAEQVLAKITGQAWTMRMESLPAPANGHEAIATETPMQKRRRIQDDIMKRPLPSRAKEVLGAIVVDVEDGFGNVAAAPPVVVAADDGFDAIDMIDGNE